MAKITKEYLFDALEEIKFICEETEEPRDRDSTSAWALDDAILEILDLVNDYV